MRGLRDFTFMWTALAVAMPRNDGIKRCLDCFGESLIRLAMTKYLGSSVASLPQNDDKRKRGSILEIKSGFCETSNEDRT